MTSNEKSKPHEIDWVESFKRAQKASLVMSPMVFPKVKEAIELEKATRGAGEELFKSAVREVITDDENLIESMWKSILASLMNPLNGYCW